MRHSYILAAAWSCSEKKVDTRPGGWKKVDTRYRGVDTRYGKVDTRDDDVVSGCIKIIRQKTHGI